jgi:hypothetical protein
LVLGNEKIENIHQNDEVRKVKEHIQKKLEGVKEDNIFPIKNYVNEVEFDVALDVLLLDALQHMLKCAQDYLDTK